MGSPNAISTTESYYSGMDNATCYPMHANDTYGTENMTCPRIDQSPDPFNLAIGILYQFVFIIGVLGNGTVLYVITKYAKMKTVTNWYIFNLALSDMLFLTSIPFYSISVIFECWPFGDILCRICSFLDTLNMYTGINCLVVMSVDRFIAVCCSMKASKYRNPKTALIVNICVWLVSSTCTIPFLIMAQYNPCSQDCGLNYELLGGNPIVVAILHIIYMSLFGFFIPLLIIAVCYILIVIRLRVVSVRTGKMEKSRKVNRLVLGVVLVFIACWGPFYTLRITLAIYPDLSFLLRGVIRYFFNLTQTMGYINSCANCFLYAFLSESFKKSFQAAWFCSKSRDTNSDLTNSSGYVLRGGRRERMIRKEIDKLSCFRKWTKLRSQEDKFDDENYLSGAQHHSYPMTTVTTAVSDACRSQE